VKDASLILTLRTDKILATVPPENKPAAEALLLQMNTGIKELKEAVDLQDKEQVYLKRRDLLNQITDIEAIVFLVPVKKPIHLLSSDEILPKEPIQLSDRILQMDVVEVGEIRTQACNASCYSWQTSPPANRLFRRPLQGGISITSTNWLGYVGTLGFVAVDSQTQSLVGVTNAHVVIKDPTDASSRNLNGVIQNEYLVTSGTSIIPDLIYQPGEFSNPPNSYIVGQVVRYIPLYLTATTRANGSTIENKVDGALVSLSGTPILSLTESYKQYGITDITYPLPFATTQELDDILSLNP
jgi:hypothetical protein